MHSVQQGIVEHTGQMESPGREQTSFPTTSAALSLGRASVTEFSCR